MLVQTHPSSKPTTNSQNQDEAGKQGKLNLEVQLKGSSHFKAG